MGISEERECVKNMSDGQRHGGKYNDDCGGWTGRGRHLHSARDEMESMLVTLIRV